MRRFGIELRDDLLGDYEPQMSYHEAAQAEKQLAQELRDEGYGVWQN